MACSRLITIDENISLRSRKSSFEIGGTIDEGVSLRCLQISHFRKWKGGVFHRLEAILSGGGESGEIHLNVPTTRRGTRFGASRALRDRQLLHVTTLFRGFDRDSSSISVSLVSIPQSINYFSFCYTDAKDSELQIP